MLEWLKSKPQPSHPEIRDTLFGDMPISQWISTSQAEPWESFAQAKRCLDSNDYQAAINRLQGVLAMPGLESRHYLQAWHFLRGLGVNPQIDQEKQVLGVVVEVPVKGGLDLVAGYADHSARYYNFSGAGVIWERPDHSLDAVIDRLLQVGSRTIQAIGPWKESRPAAPPKGHARINLLSPSGLHFGQGPSALLFGDRLAKPVIDAALLLMMELMKLMKLHRK